MAPPKTDNWIRRFIVSDPKRHKKGFTIYKVTSIVYPRASPEAVTKVVVWKRFSDFKKLHQDLKTKHLKLHLQDKFPIFVKAKFFGRFEDDVIEERRKCAVMLLEFIASHPPLFTSAVFVKFFESGYSVDDEPDTTTSKDDMTEVNSRDIQPVVDTKDTAPTDIPPVLSSKDVEHVMRTDGPLLKLGGTWKHRQQADSISLSSRSSDEAMCCTDTDSASAISSISSPLQSSDLQFFDPQQQSSPSSPQEVDRTTPSSQLSNSCLGSGREDMNATAAYILEAASHVSQAQQFESKGDFESAFAFYKTSIACLLSGVQGDVDTRRKLLVREKTARYLLQAEKIYSQHLATKSSQLSVWDELERPLSELQYYKVLGVVGNVMLVLHTIEDCCYAVKVLHKSPCPVNSLRHSVVPQDVPYMVKLYKYYETEHAVFLILQHASGGKLWDHVSSYFQSLPSTPVHELTTENVYLGKKLIQDEASVCEEEEDHSYLQLIRDYTSGTSHDDEQQESSNVDVLSQECSTMHDTVPDLLQQDAGIWKNLDTMDLVENAQKLLESVNRTLLKSETIAGLSEHNSKALLSNDIKDRSRVENAQKLLESINKTMLKSETITSQSEEKSEVFHRSSDVKEKLSKSVNRTLVKTEPNAQSEQSSASNVKGKTIVRCKSEDTSNVRRRRLSSGRRRSATAHVRTSSERRYSSDDLMEGHGRGMSGSLDRAQQLSRLKAMIDCPKPHLPEANIRVWAAELVVALNSLHQWGIICRDLNPDNILLGEKGHLLLTYMCRWMDVDSLVSPEAVERLYAAPEVNGIFELTPAADWWSFGALTFELLTGKTLVACHPGGIHSHTILNVPEYISTEAKSLLTELLRHNPHERLGSGVNGIQDLKSHPFFHGVDWDAITSV